MPDWLYIAALVLATMTLFSVVLLSLAGRLPAEPDSCQECGHGMDDHHLTRYASPCDSPGCGCLEYCPSLDWMEKELQA